MSFLKDLSNKVFRLDEKLIKLSKSVTVTPEEIRKLVKWGAHVDAKDENGETALMHSADQGRINIMETLLELGANIDEQDKKGQTASMKAAISARKDALAFLIKKKARTDLKDKDHKTTFDYAGKHLQKEVMKLMDTTLIELCCQEKRPTKEELKKAIENGALVDARDKDGNTAFILAVARRDIETARNLKELGADVNAQNDDGVSALMCTTLNKDKEMATALVKEMGADINLKDKNGNNAFFIAVISKDMDMAEHLKNLKADVNAQNKDGYSAVVVAAINGDTDAIKKLKEWGAVIDKPVNDGTTACICAAENGHFDTLKALVELGADIYKTNDYGLCALNYVQNEDERNELIQIYKEKHPDDNRPHEQMQMNVPEPDGYLTLNNQKIPYYNGKTEDGQEVSFYMAFNGQGQIQQIPFKFVTDAEGNKIGIQEFTISNIKEIKEIKKQKTKNRDLRNELLDMQMTGQSPAVSGGQSGSLPPPPQRTL